MMPTRPELGPRQVAIIAICASVAMVDGFDTQSIAFVAPEIATAWRASPSAFGLVFGAGLSGSLFGALGFGVAGDRFGRKPALVAALFLFAAITAMTPLAGTIAELAIIRFVTGLGLGGALPGAISITTESVPARLRATLVALMFCGFPLGAVIGGVVSARLIPAFGWPSVFYLGGAVPIALLPLVLRFVPESMQAAPETRRSPVASLFSQGRSRGTLLIWSSLFLSLLLTYFLISWIPLLSRQAGVEPAYSVLAVAALNLGAIAGCLLIGRLADRFGHATLFIGSGFALGAIAIAAVGAVDGSGLLLVAASFSAGAFSLGAQMCTVVFCASFYDAPVRATGIGWAIGIGRIGSIVGPVLGGFLIASGMSAGALFALIGAMSLGSAAIILVLGRAISGREELVHDRSVA